ncbi:MAG: helix-turn-helix transcriptional regulator [Oscillospiraceae bacterium]|nr:helix-turn-helix transcriptional regulator [Oscillospiraceae bacterium]
MFSYEALGRVVCALRKEKHWTQEVLSGFAGIARTHLTMIEKGTIHANMETIWRVIAALGVTPADFFTQVQREMEKENQ